MLLMLTSFGLSAQTKTVTGTVYDDNNIPVIGATVMEESTQQVVSTDIDGKYVIEVPDNASIKVLYMGYQEQIVAVGEQSTLDFVLAPEENMLDEIVLDALGFERKTDKLGQAVSQVKASALTSSGETSVANAMQGKMAGVRMNASSGDPGAATNIRIRGANTITGSTQPLIVVDGIPISNASRTTSLATNTGNGVAQQSRLNDINPNDIASMQVLKGASAAALWGSRASNGVILITTKSGKKGLKVNYKATVGFSDILKDFDFQEKYGQGSAGKYNSTSNTGAWGDKIADRSGGADVYYTAAEKGYFVPQGKEDIEANRIYQVKTKNSKETFVNSNRDEVFQTGVRQDHTISLSGGNEEGTIYLGLGWLNDDGIVKNSNYKRYTANLNATRKFNEYVKLNIKGKYSRVEARRIEQGSNTAALLLNLHRTPADFDIRNSIGSYIDKSGKRFDNVQRTFRGLFHATGGIYNSPLWVVERQKSLNEVNRYIFSSELDIFPLGNKDLNIKLRGGIDGNSDFRTSYYPKYTTSTNRFARAAGALLLDRLKENEMNFDAMVRYVKDLTPSINSSYVVGWNINNREFVATETIAENVLNNTETTTVSNYKDYRNVTSERNIRSNRGYFTANFGIEDQVFIDLTGALEAASTISDPFFYPAASVAWQFTKASFFPENEILSFGKVRASWGQVGVQPAPYRASTFYEGNFTYSDGGFSRINTVDNGGGFRVDNSKGNNNLKPEIKTEMEFGLETRFLNDAITMSATYYMNNVKDILLNAPTVPSSEGYTSFYQNAAELENKGFELELSANLLKGMKDFSLTPYLNFALNRNKVTDLNGVSQITLGGSINGVHSSAIVGEQLGVFYGNAIKKIRDVQGNLVLKDGKPQLDLDANGYYKIDPVYREVIGDPNPDWTGGFGLKAGWKGLSFNILFDHSQGGDFYSGTHAQNANRGLTPETANEVKLTKDVTNIKGKTYKAGTTVRGELFELNGKTLIKDQDYYKKYIGTSSGLAQLDLQDATWTRLREVSLSYSIPSELLEPLFLSGATIGVTGRNLYLWTDAYEDPDTNFNGGSTNARGMSYFTNPATKTYLFNVSLTF